MTIPAYYPENFIKKSWSPLYTIVNRKQILFKHLFLLHIEGLSNQKLNSASVFIAMTTHERRKIFSNKGLVLLLLWPPVLILKAWRATCWCQWWISTWFQACKVSCLYRCEIWAKLHHVGPQACQFSSTQESHGISKVCLYSKRKAQVFAYAGPYLIAGGQVSHFSLSMSAICVNANTNKKYRELQWHY